MIKCSSNIITCLRSYGIEPICSSKSFDYLGNMYREYAIDYSIENASRYFHSLNDTNDQWWQVDLKMNVLLLSYKITAENWCDWVKSWSILVSNNENENSFIAIDSQNSSNLGKIIDFKQNIHTRYLRVQGGADNCQRPYRLAFRKIYLYGIIPSQITCHKQLNLQLDFSIPFIFPILQK